LPEHEPRPQPGTVRDWFARRTVDDRHPSPDEVAELAHGQRITVVLPARNEAATVGTVVTRLRERLIERVALLDEIVVVDSHSSDQTADVARRAGARVVSCTHSPQDGKGGALRSGIDAVDADVVVFLDADVEAPHDGFVTGLVAPLLRDPDLVLVKAFYDRPFLPDGAVADDAPDAARPSGGGRVTELVARPEIADRAPALAGFAQPLSGEYAVRRTAVYQHPFVSGYGVDIGLLLTVLERYGLDAMAQVDLGRRVHRHQDLVALGRMALQVRASFDLCLDGRSEVTDVHTRFVRDDSDRLVLQHDRVVTRLLPPPP
jgi:glucosyl-3-phosphoglycerate synthase